MKSALSAALCLSLTCSASYAADSMAVQKLNVQKSSALPAHLTTRVQWSKFPQPHYKNEDLKDQNRAAIIRIFADESGQISKVNVQESTGLNALDQLLIDAVLQARVKPYVQADGTTLPTVGYQTFNLTLLPEPEVQPVIVQCHYRFNSNNWQVQQHPKKSPDFTYRTQPNALQFERALITTKPRLVKFSFKSNKNGELSNIKLKHSSGIHSIDQQVLQAVAQAQVDVPHKFWLFRSSKFNDQIELNVKNCTD